MRSIVFGSVAGMSTSAGSSSTLRKTISGYAKCGVRWKMASTRCIGVSGAFINAAQELARGLHRALGPAELLRAEGADVFRQLGRA